MLVPSRYKAASAGRNSTDNDNSQIIRAALNLITVVTILVAFGLVMLYSASSTRAGVKFFSNQLIWISLGVAGGTGCFIIGYRRMAELSLIWMLLSFFALILCLFFDPINGAHRWLQFGSFSIQPSEFTKVAVALFVAKYCSDHPWTFSKIRSNNGLIKLGVATLPVLAAVLAGRDFGTTILISATAFITLLAAGLYVRYFVFPLIGLGLISAYIYFFDAERLARATSFMHPELVHKGEGYQLWNSLLALGSGNWFGIGFMESRMKAKYLPEAHTDFILAIIGEELGFIAIFAIILLYSLFCWNAIKISLKAYSRLGTLLGFALCCGIVLQAIINLLVVSGSAPTKGMPAPFISYGGSNMISCLVAVGLLVSIASEAYDADADKRIRETICSKLFFFMKWKKNRK